MQGVCQNLSEPPMDPKISYKTANSKRAKRNVERKWEWEREIERERDVLMHRWAKEWAKKEIDGWKYGERKGNEVERGVYESCSIVGIIGCLGRRIG